LIDLRAELGSPSYRELVSSCLSFPTRPITLETEFITLDIVKNLRRGQTITIQFQDSNGQMFVDEKY
jgi:hypothetical protein